MGGYFDNFKTRREFYLAKGVPENIVEEIIVIKSKSARHRKFLLWRDKVCQNCGETKNLTVDHIIPRAITHQGKKQNLNNKQILCQSCNYKKGSKIYD